MNAQDYQDIQYPLILNEDALNGFQVSFTKGKVEIVGYNEIYKSLLMLSDYLNNIDVTEDNIKESKKLVARVAKATKEMNNARIDNKRRFMEPFEIYESQVKSLTELVKSAEETVRQQIRELEEIERQNKRDRLEEIFEKRKVHFKHGDLMDFEMFIKPQYLNKSYSFDKAEQNMVDWINTFDKDIQLMFNLSDDGYFEFEEALQYYFENPNMTQVLDHFTKKKAQVEQAKEYKKSYEAKQKGLDEEVVTVILNKKDFETKVVPILVGMGVKYICA